MFRKLFLNWFLSKLMLPRDVHRYAFRQFSSRIMLKTKDKEMTYGQLQDRSYRLVAAWHAMGLKKGDIVFTQVKAEEELFEIRTAGLEMGIVLTSFHQAHPADFIIFAAGEAPPKLFIVNPDYGVGSVEALSLSKPEIPIWVTGEDKQYEYQIASHDPLVSTETILSDDPMGLGFTSGTTGIPKGLISTHGAAIASLKLMVKNLEQAPDRSAKNINLTAIPFVGAGSGLIMPTMLSGATLVVLEEYSPENLVATIKQNGVTRLFVTPSQLIDLLEMPKTINNDMATVSHIIYGTAPMPAAKLEEAIKRFGPIFQQGYGQAEILPPVSMLHSAGHMKNGEIATRAILSSCGKVVDGVEVRIVDNNGKITPSGQVGAVQVKTPTRFKTYLNSKQNEGVILDDGFFVTGDHGYLDSGNYLHILDRQPDLIASDGGIIYPRLVEEEVHDHPAVRECCLVAVAGEPVLCVSVREAYLETEKDIIKEEIMLLLKSRIQPWQMPEDIVFEKQMPRSLLGKVLRREVRDKLNAVEGS
jgi:fatty-acyl-CoA synthase